MASSTFILLGVLLCIVNAQIIVYKRHATEIAVATRDLNIEVTVFNVGEGTVYDVKISDPWDEKDFVVVNGTTEGRFERILPGGNVTLAFGLRPKESAIYSSEAAKVSYRNNPKDEPLQAFSNYIGDFGVLTPATYDRKFASHLTQWLVYLGLIGVTIIPSYNTWNSLRKSQN